MKKINEYLDLNAAELNAAYDCVVDHFSRICFMMCFISLGYYMAKHPAYDLDLHNFLTGSTLLFIIYLVLRYVPYFISYLTENPFKKKDSDYAR